MKLELNDYIVNVYDPDSGEKYFDVTVCAKSCESDAIEIVSNWLKSITYFEFFKCCEGEAHRKFQHAFFRDKFIGDSSKNLESKVDNTFNFDSYIDKSRSAMKFESFIGSDNKVFII